MAAAADKTPQKLPDVVKEDTEAFKEQFKTEEDDLNAQIKDGLLMSDYVTLTGPAGDDYECVVEAAPVWLARGYKLKKNGN